LSVAGDTSLGSCLTVVADSDIGSFAFFSGDYLSVGGNETIDGNLQAQNGTIEGNMFIRIPGGPAQFITTDLTVDSDVYINGTLNGVDGFFDSDLSVSGSLSIGDDLDAGNAHFISVRANSSVVNKDLFQTIDGATAIDGNLGVDFSAGINGTLFVLQHVSLDGVADEISGNVSICSELSVIGSATIDGQLTADHNVSFSNDLTVIGDLTIDHNLDILGDSNINLTGLHVNGSVFFNGLDTSVVIDGTLDVAGDLTGNKANVSRVIVTGNSTFDNLVVTGNSSFAGSPIIDGDLTVLGLLSVGNFSLGAIENITDVLGTTTITGELTVDGSAEFDQDLSVVHDMTVVGRFDVNHGPFGFRYPGVYLNAIVGPSPSNIRQPNLDLESCCSEYLVNFAPVGSPLGSIYSLNLTGYTLNILNPELSGVLVYYMNTILFDATTLVYSYSVGDIIMLKGSPVLSTSIVILDFEDVLRSGFGGAEGNIYNGRDLVTEAMSSFARILQSDEIFLYMYSPRPNVGFQAGTPPVLQSAPVEWVRIGLGDERY